MHLNLQSHLALFAIGVLRSKIEYENGFAKATAYLPVPTNNYFFQFITFNIIFVN